MELRFPATRGFRRSLRIARYEFKTQWRHWAALRRARRYHGRRSLRLNVGCGGNIKEGWINIDAGSEADLRLDLREALPFDDGSVSVVYSEHFFEHLQFPREASHFLRECFRVLEPAGTLDIGVPDTEWPLRAYVRGESDYFDIAAERFHPQWCDTKLHHLNFHFRQGDEHKYAYDEETLASVLRKRGFVGVTRRDFDLRLDSPERSVGTLYMRAFRPTDAKNPRPAEANRGQGYVTPT